MLRLYADICVRVIAGYEHLTSLRIEICVAVSYFDRRRQILPAQSQVESEPTGNSPVIGHVSADLQETRPSPDQLKRLCYSSGYTEQEVRHGIAGIAG